MKNNILKKCALSALIASCISPAIASQENISVGLTSQISTQAENFDKKLSKAVNISKEYSDETNELKLNQVRLKNLQVQDEIRLLKEEQDKGLMKKEFEAKLAEKEALHQQEVESLKAEISALNEEIDEVRAESIKKDLENLDKAFVTRVTGSGKNKSVSIFYKGQVYERKAGEKIGKGISVIHIKDNGAVLKHKGKRSFSELVSLETAISLSQPKQDSNRDDDREKNDRFVGVADSASQSSQAGQFQGITSMPTISMPPLSN